MSATAVRGTSYIDPDRLYTLRGFHFASGISETRVRHARLSGLDIPTIGVGKRKFIRGVEAIEYIERLAELERPSEIDGDRELSGGDE